MKKSFLLTALVLLALTINSQTLLVEDFNYPIGSGIKEYGWDIHINSGLNDSITVTDGLYFSGYSGSGIGGAALIDSKNADQNKLFSPQASGSIYASFLMKVIKGGGTYFLHFIKTNTTGLVYGGYYCKVWINANGNGIGISSYGSGPTQFLTIIPNNTYLVTIKYDCNNGKSYLNLFNSLPSFEPATPHLSSPDSLKNGNPIGAIAFRQQVTSLINASGTTVSNTINVIVDGIRVAKSWKDLFTNSSVVQTSPQLFLSTGSVKGGGSITITGKSFTPNSTALLSFTSGSSVTVNTDATGQFSYNYVVPANLTGEQSVSAIDNSTNQRSISKPFKIITTNTTNQTYLKIISPNAGQNFQETRAFNVIFEDQLFLKNGNFTYPRVINNPASRLYSYNIEYQVGVDAQWQVLKTVTGSALIDSKITKTETLIISNANNSCQVRVIDNYNKTIIANSVVFSVVPYTSSLKVEMDWDQSFPKPNATLQGLAADGTARVFLKVSKLNQTGSAISNVKVKIEDGTSSTPSLLGKIQQCNDTGYSLEANNATTLSAIDESADANGKFWFWYVAPDDFSDSTTPFYANAKERFVNAIITATKKDGTTENETLKIKIVRPPLVLVHGLAGNRKSWDEFNYNNGTEKFIYSSLWYQKRAIELDPQAAYIENAFTLLNSSDKRNSLQGNIDAFHNQGYACNRIDYVCHSMGGCIMRTAINSFSNKFYSKNSYENTVYKTYEKGFINKAITINTPHNNSPLADLISEYTPNLPWYVAKPLKVSYGIFDRPFFLNFITPIDNEKLFNTVFEASPAVKNLQVNSNAGGINLAETKIKNHLISSDINLYSAETASFLADLDKYLELIDDLIDVTKDFGGWDPTTQAFLDGMSNLNKVARVFTFLEWYSQQKGFANFWGDGDVVVPLSSQLGGVSTSSENVTIFTSGSSIKAKYNYWHCKINEQSEVGDKVKLLLNSSISSPLFSSTIPATPTSPVLMKKVINTQNKANSEIYDTLKMSIVSPIRNQTFFADSTIYIQFHIKDTTNLVNIKTYFQSTSFNTVKKTEYQSYDIQISPDLMGSQLLSVIATYRINGLTVKHIDTLSVNIQTTASLIDFEVNPKVSSIRKLQPFYPSYLAFYSTFIANVPFNDPQLSIAIDNPSVVSFNSTGHYFEGVCDSTSSTFAVVSYKDLKDTIYIEVQVNDTLAIPINTEIENSNLHETSDNLSIKLFPNPTNGQFNIEIENLLQHSGKIIICNILGQIISEQTIQEKSVTLDISKLPQGIYIVRFRDEFGNESTKKIQKL